jgi:hypothetical protein
VSNSSLNNLASGRLYTASNKNTCKHTVDCGWPTACTFTQSTFLINIIWRRNNSTERNSGVCSTKHTHWTSVLSNSFAVRPCKMKRPVFHMGVWEGSSCGISNGRKSAALLSDAHTDGVAKLWALILNTRYVCIWYRRSTTAHVIQPVVGLYNDQLNAHVFKFILFFHLILPYMFRAFF